MKATQFIWNEPNRAQTPPLHIASRGERFSTVTGVWWLDEFRFVANHRNGLRIALFDIRALERPLAVCNTPHLSDDVAAKQIDANRWEVAVSGCWDAVCSTYQLTIDATVEFKLISTVAPPSKTFSHGIAFGKNGELCLAFHTGTHPRIMIANRAWTLPEPWGARDVCYDPNSDKYYAVAVSNNPKSTAYDDANTSIWELDSAHEKWRMFTSIPNMHSDSCQVYKERIWFPDQNADRIIGLCLNGIKRRIQVRTATRFNEA